MYTENCKTLFKEMKEYLSKWKNILHLWIRRYSTIKIHTFSVLLLKKPRWLFWAEIDKFSLKVIWKMQRIQETRCLQKEE